MPKHVAAVREASRDKKAHFRVIFLAFSALGFHVGVWAVLIADLVRSLGLGAADLGVALALQSGAGILFLLVGGRFADSESFGRRPVLVAGATGTGGYLVLVAFVENYAALLAVLAFSGTASLYDLAVNALGGDFEREHDARAMTLFHAAFSGSAALGAIGSGAALALGAGFGTVYVAAGSVVLAFAVAAIRLPIPAHAPDEEAAFSSGGMFPLLRVPVVLSSAVVVFMCFSTDAALEGFTSLYLRDFLGAGAFAGGAGLAALYFAGAVSRLFGAVAVSRFGDGRVLVVSGFVAAFGLGVVVATDGVVIAALGLVLVGVALAPVAPILASIVSRAVPANSGRAMSLVIASGYVAFTSSPVVFGGLADLASIRASFMLLLALCVAASIVAWRMPK